MTSPSHTDRHARRRTETRAKLIEAARTLFARQGVENTRINEITDAADVGSARSITTSSSKGAITEAVLSETVAAQGAAVDAMTRDLDDPAEVVAVAHRYFVRLARTDRDWAWLLFRLDLSHNVMLRALGPFARRDLDRGIRAGRFDVPTPGSRCSGRRSADGRDARGAVRRRPERRRLSSRGLRAAAPRADTARRNRGGRTTTSRAT